jgi:hypothetical protein
MASNLSSIEACFQQAFIQPTLPAQQLGQLLFELDLFMNQGIRELDNYAMQISASINGGDYPIFGNFSINCRVAGLIGECIQEIICFCDTKSKSKQDPQSLAALWQKMQVLQALLNAGGADKLPGCVQLISSASFICFTHFSALDLSHHTTSDGIRIRYDDVNEYLVDQQTPGNSFQQMINKACSAWVRALNHANLNELDVITSWLNTKLDSIELLQNKQAIKWSWVFLLWREMDLSVLSNDSYRKGLNHIFKWLEISPLSDNLSDNVLALINMYQSYEGLRNYFYHQDTYWEHQARRLLENVVQCYHRFATEPLYASPDLIEKIIQINANWQLRLFTVEQEAFQFNLLQLLMEDVAFHPFVFTLLYIRLMESTINSSSTDIVVSTAAASSQNDILQKQQNVPFNLNYLNQLMHEVVDDRNASELLAVFSALFNFTVGIEVSSVSPKAIARFKQDIVNKYPNLVSVKDLTSALIAKSIAFAPNVDITTLSTDEQATYLNRYWHISNLLSVAELTTKDKSKLIKNFQTRELILNKLTTQSSELFADKAVLPTLKLFLSDQGVQQCWLQHSLVVFSKLLDADDDEQIKSYVDAIEALFSTVKNKGRLLEIKNLSRILFGYLNHSYPIGIKGVSSIIPSSFNCEPVRQKILAQFNEQLEVSLAFDIQQAHQKLALLDIFGESPQKISQLRAQIDEKVLFNTFVDNLNHVASGTVKKHSVSHTDSLVTSGRQKDRRFQPAVFLPGSAVVKQPKAFPFEFALPIEAFPMSFIELAKHVVKVHGGDLPLTLAGQAIADLLDGLPLSQINDFDCIWHGTPALWQLLCKNIIANKDLLGLETVALHGEHLLHVVSKIDPRADAASETFEIDICYREIPLDGRLPEQILLEDAQQRDFKHTAMHIVLSEEQLIRATTEKAVPNKGKLAIHNKLGAYKAARTHQLDFIGDARKSIAYDPLRLLRAYRKLQRTAPSYQATPDTADAIAAASKNVFLWINDLQEKKKMGKKAWVARASQISHAFGKVFNDPTLMEKLIQNGVMMAMLGLTQPQCEKLWQAYLALEKIYDSQQAPSISVMSKQICFYLLVQSVYGRLMPSDEAQRKNWRPFHLIKWYNSMSASLRTIAKTLNGSKVLNLMISDGYEVESFHFLLHQ